MYPKDIHQAAPATCVDYDGAVVDFGARFCRRNWRGDQTRTEGRRFNDPVQLGVGVEIASIFEPEHIEASKIGPTSPRLLN